MKRHKAEIVQFQPDVDRILAALAFAISDAVTAGGKPTQYDLLKTLFLADRRHLNEYGRPVSFDNYVAMIHGPVPSCAYDLLKGDPNTLRRHRIERLPWSVQTGPNGKMYFADADISTVDDVLAESDREAIRSANKVIQSLTFGQIRKLTHEDAAYIDAWEDEGERKQFPMSLGLLFESPDFERASELADLTKI